MRNRGAIIDLGDKSFRELEQRTLATGNAHLMRWDPWVRSYLVAQELVDCMTFKVEVTNDVMTVGLSFSLPDGSGPFPGVKIVRPRQDAFEKQLEKVMYWAELREERMPEILTQIEGQNCFWGSIVPIQTDRMRHTRELLDAAVQFAVFAEMRFKHEFACWRPIDLSPQVQPMITTPGHGAFPSGHCTQSFAIFEVLKVLLNTTSGKGQAGAFNLQFQRLATRVSTNRVIAGVHFPIDNIAGRFLGTVLGQFFSHVAAAPAIDRWMIGTFDGAKLEGSEEFLPNEKFLPKGSPDAPKYYTVDSWDKPPPVAREGKLRELWIKARKECEDLRLVF